MSGQATVRTDAGEFAVGEVVWVDGWPKVKAATYTLRKIVPQTDGNPDVQVVFDHRGRRQIHSVLPERLRKRRQPKGSGQ